MAPIVSCEDDYTHAIVWAPYSVVSKVSGAIALILHALTYKLGYVSGLLRQQRLIHRVSYQRSTQQ